ncbi:Hypothetical predicted protein, partial [Paramuricea clavata]
FYITAFELKGLTVKRTLSVHEKTTFDINVTLRVPFKAINGGISSHQNILLVESLDHI